MKTSLLRRALSLSVALNMLAVIVSIGLIEKKGGLPWVRRQLPRVLGAMQGERIPSGAPNTTLGVYGQLSVGPGDIVLFGDDVIAPGEWHELLGDPRAKNRAIAGSAHTPNMMRHTPSTCPSVAKRM